MNSQLSQINTFQEVSIFLVNVSKVFSTFFPLCNSIATLSKSCKIIIGALNYYDPFGWHKNRSEEAKANGLVKEINNGRLAMLGIFGFLCEQTIPGSVPGLSGIVQPYSGEVMAPLAKSILPTL